MLTTELQVQGTHCTACKALIEDVCAEVPGVVSCDVNYQTGQTVLVHEPSLNWDELTAAINALGPYRVVQPTLAA